MTKRSWFKSEAELTAAVHYLIAALGVLGLLAALLVARLRADG
ncbi:MAG: hypothetical protein ABW208_18150 [Pyrinomonadaceae bacterium]